MKIALNAQELSALKTFLNQFEDSEQLSDSEYVVDLFDIEPPISIDLTLMKDAVRIEGAAELKFDEEMDGWYIGDRLEEPEAVRAALAKAGALGQ